MKILIKLTLITLLIALSTTLKVHDKIDEHDYVWISEDKSQWIGYLPQCEFVCKNKEEGEVCDTHPKVCCEKGQCTQKYNFTICNEPVKHFKCDRKSHMHYENEKFFINKVPELKPIFHPKD